MKTKLIPRRRGLAAALLIGASTVALSLSHFSAPDANLIRRATRVIPLRSQMYSWRTPTAVVVDGDRKVPSSFVPEATQFNCATDKRSRIAAMNKRLTAMEWWRTGRSISPDGKWALLEEDWNGYAVAPIESGFDVRATMSGQEERPRTIERASRPIWMPDSRGWVYLAHDIRSIPCCLYSVQQNVAGHATACGRAFGCPDLTSSWDGPGSTLLGFVSLKRVLALPMWSTYYSRRDGSLALYEFSLGREPSVRQYRIKLPAEAAVVSVALSHDGRRLAIVTRERRRPGVTPIHRLVGRWWPQVLPKERDSFSVYTLRADGGGWRPLGELPLNAAEDDDRIDMHLALQWVPGDRELSFVYRDALWCARSE